MKLTSLITPAWIKQANSRRREREMTDLVVAAWKRYWEAVRRQGEQTEGESSPRPARAMRQNFGDER